MGRGFLILAILAAVAGGFWIYNRDKRAAVTSQVATEIGTLNAQNIPWTEYTAPLGQFKVLLPSHPHHSREARGDKEYEIFLAPRDESTIYSINMISFSEKQEKDLEQFLNEMLKSNPKNLVKDIHKGTFNNSNAFDFTV